MVCFVPSVYLSIRKSCQRRACLELGTVRNWVDHCIIMHTMKAYTRLKTRSLLSG